MLQSEYGQKAISEITTPKSDDKKSCGFLRLSKNRLMQHGALCVLLLLTLFRIWLIQNTGWLILADAIHDDMLMVRIANEIGHLAWAGEYDQYTLAKSAGYPLFLAIGHWLHLPYGVWLGLYIALVSAVTALSLRPLTQNKIIEGLIYLFILYQPIGFSYAGARIYRNALTPWAALLVFACLIALYLRRNEPSKTLYKWSLACAVSLALFWHIREDSVWILPFVIGASLTILIFKKHSSSVGLLKYIGALIFPLIFLGGSCLAVRALNYSCYGVFLENDRTQGTMPEAGSLLMDIEAGSDKRGAVWVSRKALKAAKDASPTMAKLEGVEYLWEKWAHDIFNDEEVWGDHFYWVMRNVLEYNGYFQGNAPETQEVFAKIASELRDGFDAGILKRKEGGWRLSSQHRAVYPDDITSSLWPALKVYISMGRHAYCDAYTRQSITGGNSLLPQTEQVLRMKFDGESSPAFPFSNAIINAYKIMGNPLMWSALLGFIIICLQCARHKKIRFDCLGILMMISSVFWGTYIDVGIAHLFSQWIDPTWGSYFYATAGYTAIAYCECIILSCLLNLRRSRTQALTLSDANGH